MGVKVNVANGLAPNWIDVPNGAGWTRTDRDEVLGIWVEGAGNVAFKTDKDPNWIVRSMPDFFSFAGDFTDIGTTADGTTATGILIGTTG